jgi:hypothetical protein
VGSSTVAGIGVRGTSAETFEERLINSRDHVWFDLWLDWLLVVQAIGGGSPIDAGKAISALITNTEGHVIDYVEVGVSCHDVAN